jgi:Zn finger protein HypA/HybF involved in hydrogenase expression
VTAKALSFCDEKYPVSLYGSTKYVQDVVIADETGRIKLNLWEDMIDKVIEGKTYLFKNVSTRNFNNLPSLTTTMATSVQIVDDIESTSDLVVMTNTKITHGQIQQVQCLQKFKCGACKKSLELTEEDTKRVKCPYCHLKSNISTLQQTFTYRINLEDDSSHNLFRLVCFQSTMISFLKEQNKEELLQNLDQLEDFLLDISSVTCVHVEGTEVISSLKIE